MQFYNIGNQNEYYIELQKVNIEDIGDNFMSQDEVHNHPWKRFPYSLVNEAAVNQALELVTLELEKPGAKKRQQLDDDVFHVLDRLMWYDRTKYNINNGFISLKKQKRDRTVVSKTDYKLLTNLIINWFNHTHGTDLKANNNFSYLNSELIVQLKKLTTWKQLVEYHTWLSIHKSKTYLYQKNTNLKLLKQIWLNPEIISEMKK